jgi:hypothetical protein
MDGDARLIIGLINATPATRPALLSWVRFFSATTAATLTVRRVQCEPAKAKVLRTNTRGRVQMTRNVGGMDRTIRIVGGALLIALAATGSVGWWGWLGIVPLATGLMGWCPPYAMFGINTCARAKSPAAGSLIGSPAPLALWAIVLSRLSNPRDPATRRSASFRPALAYVQIIE